MPNVVFDSWALIAFFDDEPAAEEVEQIISKSTGSQKELVISVLNLGEIWYNYARNTSETLADEIVSKIRIMKFTVESVDWDLAKIAAQFKAKGGISGISYADCFVAALAKNKKAPLVTGDPEFRQLEDEIDIIWV